MVPSPPEESVTDLGGSATGILQKKESELQDYFLKMDDLRLLHPSLTQPLSATVYRYRKRTVIERLQRTEDEDGLVEEDIFCNLKEPFIEDDRRLEGARFMITVGEMKGKVGMVVWGAEDQDTVEYDLTKLADKILDKREIQWQRAITLAGKVVKGWVEGVKEKRRRARGANRPRRNVHWAKSKHVKNFSGWKRKREDEEGEEFIETEELVNVE